MMSVTAPCQAKQEPARPCRPTQVMHKKNERLCEAKASIKKKMGEKGEEGEIAEEVQKIGVKFGEMLGKKKGEGEKMGMMLVEEVEKTGDGDEVRENLLDPRDLNDRCLNIRNP